MDNDAIRQIKRPRMVSRARKEACPTERVGGTRPVLDGVGAMGW